jgi:hypothetical protein
MMEFGRIQNLVFPYSLESPKEQEDPRGEIDE